MAYIFNTWGLFSGWYDRSEEEIEEEIAREQETAEKKMWEDRMYQDMMADEIKKYKEENKKYVLYTIGYEKKNIDEYMQLLKSNNINMLCDVRKNPWSYKTDFIKSKLKTHCENNNIEYVHLDRLGIASELRKNLKTKEDYNKLFQDYQSNFIVGHFYEHISFINNSIHRGKTIALTCFEKDHEFCHRHCITNHIEDKEGFTIKNL